MLPLTRIITLTYLLYFLSHTNQSTQTHFYQYDNRSSTLWSVLVWLPGSTARLLITKRHTCALKSGWEKTTSQGDMLRMKCKQTRKGGKLGKNKIHRPTSCTVFSCEEKAKKKLRKHTTQQQLLGSKFSIKVLVTLTNLKKYSRCR